MDHGMTTGWEVLPPSPSEAASADEGDGSTALGAESLPKVLAGASGQGGGPAEVSSVRGGGPGAGSAVAEAPAPAVPGAGVRGWGVRGGRLWAWAWWPLLAVLVVQAALSLRLLGADTAFQDEAAYLWAGHLEWAHWLHGAAVPPFQAYFSGAPVIYPPVGALADSVGGLAGARVLSLVFMLGATALLWGTAERLYGRRAAFFAAALFAVLGPTLHLGSFATYDSLSVFLVALAAWCVVRAGDRADATGWMVAAGVVLALANAAAYSSALFDPVVILVAMLTAFPRPGRRAAIARGATLVTVLAALLLAGTLIGGSSYISGIEQTTLARVGGSDSVMTVLAHSWAWTGLVFVAALCGVAISWARRQPAAQTWLLAVLALAALLVPAEQAGLQTLASLNKHGDMGTWFAAIAAGYAVDRLIAAAPAGQLRAVTCGAFVIALAFPVSIGITQSRTFSTNWPNSGSFTAILRPLVDQSSGHLLVEDPSIAEYYLPAGSQWQRWSSTRNIILPSGASTGHPGKAAGVVGAGNPAAFAKYIAASYFSLVALNYADTTALDHAITADLRRNSHYHIVQVVPYGIEVPPVGQGTYVIWRYEQ
jgi:4-amino-4-deoxy-L-arabinose transferase-like glycosyltransferase